MTTPADRPHYSDGSPVPDFLDSSTRQYSRGQNKQTGAKGAEPAEPAPTVTGTSPASLATAGGTAVTITGDNLGGSTGATFGGTAGTNFAVQSETQATVTAPAKAAGTYALVVTNPAGNSPGFNVTYA